MSIEKLLERLDGVRANGSGKWMSRCPAHEDRSPSLSLREKPDGRVLMHCFGGCDTQSILDAVGLEFSDLFPACLGEFKGERGNFSAREALDRLTTEAALVAIAAANQLEGRTLSAADSARLIEAACRIGDALEFVNGR